MDITTHMQKNFQIHNNSIQRYNNLIDESLQIKYESNPRRNTNKANVGKDNSKEKIQYRPITL